MGVTTGSMHYMNLRIKACVDLHKHLILHMPKGLLYHLYDN
jgi:hypothetical protein